MNGAEKDSYTKTLYTALARERYIQTSRTQLIDSSVMYIEDEIQVSTAYKVKHWLQKVNGGTEQNDTNYILMKTEQFEDEIDAKVSPNVSFFTGFTAPQVQEVEIARDGSTVINYYYTRNSYKLTLNKGNGIESVSGGGTYKYEEVVSINAVASAGFTWAKWTVLFGAPKIQNGTVTMPANDVTLNAEAVPNTNTPYKVEHYQEKVAGGWELKDTDNLTGTTGLKVTPEVKSYAGFKSPSTETKTISADGTTVIKYYYTRREFTLTLVKGTGIKSVTGAGTYKYGETVTIKAEVEKGYTWSGWNGHHTTQKQEYTFEMSSSSISMTANATANTNTKYTIWHWRQSLDGKYDLLEEETLYGTTGTTVTPKFKEYEGFSPRGSTISTKIRGDGATLIEYYYERLSYTVTVKKGTGISSVSGGGTYKYGQNVTINASIASGYTWVKWTGTKPSTTQKYTFTMPAKDVTNTAEAKVAILYLYNKGNQCTSVTGGWQGKAVKPNWATDSNGHKAVKPTVKFNTSTISAALDSAQNFRFGNLETKKDINLTGYSKLVVEFESINTVGMYSMVGVGVGPRTTTEYYTNKKWKDTVTAGDNSIKNKTVSLDISELNSSYNVYIALMAQRYRLCNICFCICSNKSNIFSTVIKKIEL